MYIDDVLEKYKDEKIQLYCDMDGVIADYEVGKACDYDKKRPLFDSIKKLETISKWPNIDLYIFSATRESKGIGQKNSWLDIYAPFFKKENRIILSREDNDMAKSAELKANYLKDYPRDESLIMVIDDDPRNLKEIEKYSKDVILLKDTALID